MFNKVSITYYLLFFFLVFSYLFIEKPEYDKIKKNYESTLLINGLKIERIETENVLIYADYETKKWSVKGIDIKNVNQQIINKFVKRLSKIRRMEDIDLPEYDFDFKHWFKINDDLKIFIGEKLPYDEKYYLKMVSKNIESIFLVKDDSPQLDPIADKLYDINPYKRLEIIKFTNFLLTDFIDLTILPDGINEISFKKDLGKSFVINLEKEDILNTKFKKFKIDKLKIKNWKKNINNFTAAKIHKYSPESLQFKNKLGEISFNINNHKIIYSLYLTSEKEENSIAVTSSSDSYIRLVDSKDLKIIFPNEQDFLNKKIIDLQKNKNLNIEIKSRIKNVKFSGLIDTDSIIFETKGVEPLNLYSDMLKIFFKDASYVNVGDEMTILDENSFEIILNGHYLKVGHSHGIVEAFDPIDKVSYFYRDEETYKIFEKI